ncbi:MAG: VanZ family protein [Burkholderiaceae bacterium]
MAPRKHQSSAAPLALIYAALVVYASLYPFDDWRGFDANPFAFLALPWPRWWTAFDVGANLLGYLPLGALIFGALVRSAVPLRRAVGQAWLTAALLSLCMELTQNFLPRRVASNVDLSLNVLGAALGIALAMAIHRQGWVDRWQLVRERWFIQSSAGALALMVTWPLGLLIPTPVALGVGRILPRLHEMFAAIFEGTAIAPWLDAPIWTAQDFLPLSASAEVSTVALGLLAPCLLAFTITHPGWRRLAMVPLFMGLGTATTTLSTALNFGPQHAFAWHTDLFWLGLGLGAVFAALASRIAARTCMAFGLIALTALVVGVAQAPADPYFAQSLQAWEQGDFIRFHGAAQWIGWLWPFVALGYLLLRSARPA